VILKQQALQQQATIDFSCRRIGCGKQQQVICNTGLMVCEYA